MSSFKLFKDFTALNAFFGVTFGVDFGEHLGVINLIFVSFWLVLDSSCFKINKI